MLAARMLSSPRHTTRYLEAGPIDGPLMIFLHGWPEIALAWRFQMEAFAAEGWRCVAPDMRGYGGSSTPDGSSAYALSEIVEDMVELHDHLGSVPAIWVGHDLGSPVAGALASHHPKRARGVVLVSVPYFPDGFALANLLPLVDRQLYPADQYPDGQWDYCRFYVTHFDRTVSDFNADIPANSRRDLSARESCFEGAGLPVSVDQPQRRMVRFGTSCPCCDARSHAVAARRLRYFGGGVPYDRFPAGERLVSQRHRQCCLCPYRARGRMPAPTRFICEWRLRRALRYQQQPYWRAHAPRLPGSVRDTPAGRTLDTARVQSRTRRGHSLVDEGQRSFLDCVQTVCRSPGGAAPPNGPQAGYLHARNAVLRPAK